MMDQAQEEENLAEPVAKGRRAGPYIRLLALFYDLVAIAIVLFVVGQVTTLWMMVSTESPFIGDPQRTRAYIFENEFHLLLINWVILGVTFIFIQYIYPLFKRQTFGMLFTNLTVADEYEQDVTKAMYIKRELFKIILFPTYIMSFSKNRRPLYEKFSNTYLLK
ncbi:RDD family protein [Salipaludibacillus sp. HK11]|uniref:RDD family protein n=1 Tax=Salipaludibacillus sp. HK11 TaxID=3394320 RepID=UPI0039FDE133